MHYRRLYKKDRHKYANPFFPKNRRQKKNGHPLSLRKIILLAGVFLTLSGWVYLFIFSKYFRIARIDVYGDGKLVEASVRDSLRLLTQSRSWLIFPRDNIYIFPARAAEDRLKDQLLLQEIKINKVYPGALRVEFKTKKPALRLGTEKWIYTLDITGEVIEKRPNLSLASSTAKERAEGDDLPLLQGGSEELGIASKAVEEELAQFIVVVAEEMSHGTGVAINSFSPIADSPSSLNVKTEEGWDVIFNIRINAREQIRKLSALLKEQTISKRQNLNYIDLRFGDRIFYK